MPRKSKKGRDILISRFSALGDIAMTLPSVYNACYANPGDRFYFLTRKHPAQLFINRPDNLEVLMIDPADYKGVSGIGMLAHALLKRYSIDTYVDLHDVLRTKLLRKFLMATGCKVRHINKGRAEKRKLTRANNKVLVPLEPTPQRYEATFRAAGIALADKFRSLYGESKGNPLQFVDVTQPKKEGEYWLAVAPFAKHPGKIYPFDQLAKVVENYAARKECKVYMFGFGKKESELIQTLSSKFPNVVNMAEKSLGLSSELALLSHCDVMLSMDSANMHLASLVGLRTVSIWGATHPYTGFLGWGQRESDAVQLDMTCRPCSVFGNKPCKRGDYHCLKGINPQLIIDKIDSL